MTKTTAELVAEFQARGGRAQKIEAGERTTTEHQLYAAVRGWTKPVVQRDSENEAELEREVFAEAMHCSGSSHAAMDALNEFRMRRR